MNSDLFSQFENNGFVIRSASLFDKELRATNMSSYDLLNKLTDLQKGANISGIINDFSFNILDNITKLSETLNNDEFYLKSDKEKLDRLQKNITALRNKFAVVTQYMNAEKLLLQYRQEMLNAKKKAVLLDRDTSLSASEKTAKALEIKQDIDSAINSYQSYIGVYYDKKREYNNAINGINVVDFKNDLLKSINAIEDDTKGLAITQDTKEKVGSIVSDMREHTVMFANSNIRSQIDFETLCNRYGLEYDASLKTTSKVKNKEEIKEELPSKEMEDIEEEKAKDIEPDYTGPVKDGEQLAVVSEPDKEKSPITVDPDKQIAVVQPDDLDIQDQEKPNPSPTPTEANKEPKIKVVAKRTCRWINEHKKQILIAIGIALLIIAVIVALQYLIPAITTMLQTSQVATLSSAMMENGALWHGAIASEQAALHGANTALASTIQTLTGSQAIFDTATGIWTIGGTELSKFTAGAIANATTAAGAATSLTNGVMGLGIAGLGLTGIGALLPQKSTAYKNILKNIKDLKKNMGNMSHEEVKQKVAEIVEEINKETNLTDSEKERLTGKSNKLINKSEKLVDSDTLEASVYQNLKDEIKELNNNMPNMSQEELGYAIGKLITKIRNTASLSKEEKETLIKKTRKVYGNYRKLIEEKEVEQQIEEVQEQEEERGR